MNKARSTGQHSGGASGTPPAPTLQRLPSASPDALDMQSRIGAQLHQIYEEVLQEPIPQRFLDLLNELDRVDQDRTQSDHG